MTDTDREYISEGADDEHKRYQAISRVRNRINEELSRDVEILEEHHPELLADLRKVVCESPEPSSETTDTQADAESVEPISQIDHGRDGHTETVSTIDVDSLVTTDDVPASGKEAEARRQAAAATLSLLQEFGEADSSSLKETALEAYLEAHNVGSLEELGSIPLDTYASASEPGRSLWNNSVLDVLRESEYVEKRSDSERRGGYQWTDDEV